MVKGKKTNNHIIDKKEEDSDNDDSGVINQNLLEIFGNQDDDDFQFEFLASKKKLHNRTNATLLDVLKLKMKAMDMMLLILENNKTVIKSSEINYLDEIAPYVAKAKLEK